MRKRRRKLKQQLIEDLDRAVVVRRRHRSLCEGQAFKEHICAEGLHMNEVLFPRRIFQKLPEKQKEYFAHLINCSVQCGYFHFKWGHSSEYRAWHRQRMCDIYGEETVQEYITNAPLKIKRSQ